MSSTIWSVDYKLTESVIPNKTIEHEIPIDIHYAAPVV